jgi:hypothetical protein
MYPSACDFQTLIDVVDLILDQDPICALRLYMTFGGISQQRSHTTIAHETRQLGSNGEELRNIPVMPHDVVLPR